MINQAIRNRINDFFINYLQEDVSNVEIKIEDTLAIAGGYGFYKRDEQNMIHVDKSLFGMELETTIVHEMEHLMQYSRNKSYSIKIRDIESLYNESIFDCCYDDLCDDDISYYERRQEIDSRIMSVLYAYTIQGIEGLEATYRSIYNGCTNLLLNDTVIELINNMPNSDFKTFFLDEIEDQNVVDNLLADIIF